MITKPENATPHSGADAHNGLLYENIGRGKFPQWFTASECAEIARAYGECIAAEMMTLGNHGDEWRAKFKEWVTTK